MRARVDVRFCLLHVRVCVSVSVWVHVCQLFCRVVVFLRPLQNNAIHFVGIEIHCVGITSYV